MITLKNAGKAFGKDVVLNNISFEIQPNEFVCITGPSGAGKSTLLHLMTGAEPASKGHIEIDGVDMRAVPPTAMQLYRQRIGIVFQDYKLLMNRTVEENIRFPLEVCGVPDDQIEKRVKKILEQIDMTKKRKTLPQKLSGGEKARTAIGRAIAHSPLILFADEPTGNIDPEQTDKILELFKDIHKDGATIILATHDSELLKKSHARILRIEDGTLAKDSKGTKKSETKEHIKHAVFNEKAPTKKSSGGKSIKITATQS